MIQEKGRNRVLPFLGVVIITATNSSVSLVDISG